MRRFQGLVNSVIVIDEVQIVPHDEALWRPFRRTNIVLPGRKRLKELSGLVRGLMEGTRSLLVVCNTKTEARTLFEKLNGDGWRC